MIGGLRFLPATYRGADTTAMASLASDLGAPWRRLAPFAVAALLPFLLLALPPSHWDGGLVLASAAVTAWVGAAVVLVPWSRLPSFAQVLPGAGYLLALALLREAGGGTCAGVAPVVLLPVIWLSLYGTRRQLAAMIGGGALFLRASYSLAADAAIEDGGGGTSPASRVASAGRASGAASMGIA
jgi:hypothetical protein